MAKIERQCPFKPISILFQALSYNCRLLTYEKFSCEGSASQSAELSSFCVSLPQTITADDKLSDKFEKTLRNTAIIVKVCLVGNA